MPKVREGQPAADRIFVAIFIVAFATLMLEIALIRVLSFTIWYHFAYVVISTALLGFGASGTVLSVKSEIGSKDLSGTLTRCCVGAGVSSALTLAAFTFVPLHPIDLFEDASQIPILIAYQVVSSLPFFFSGLAVSLMLRAMSQRVDRLYFWDLIGAGIGCAGVVAIMNWVSPPGAVLVSAACFCVAASVLRVPTRLGLGLIALAFALLALAPFASGIPLTPAKSKHIALAKSEKKMEPVLSRWSALFRTDLLRRTDATTYSLIDRWGLSRKAPEPSQDTWGLIFHDGTAGTPVYDLDEGDLDFLDNHILSIPYLTTPSNPNVLVIGVGGGRDIIAAKRYGAKHVTGVELDPATIELIRDGLEPLHGDFFKKSNITLVPGDGRSFVKRTDAKYDLIQLTGVDTLAATTSGAYVLAENYLYTVEAMHDYLDHLEQGGVLSFAIGHWDASKPQNAGRLLNTARQALLERGAENVRQHLMLIDSHLLFAELLVSDVPFDANQIGKLQAEANRLDFGMLLAGDQSHPLYRDLATLSGHSRADLLSKLPYRIDAVRDNQPFFFNFYRWSDLFTENNLGPTHTTALGQMVLVVILITVTLLAGIVILGPLVAFRRKGIGSDAQAKIGILGYFLAVGLGFMLFEISLLQRFVVYLGYPTYSLSVVLSSLLVSLGAGSLLSRRWVGNERRVLPVALVILGCLALFYAVGLPEVQSQTLGAPLIIRVVLTTAVLVPLGLTMGLFFPLGIRRAASIHPDLVPWGWGINGCGSVTGTILAVMLAMTFGFERVWWLALVVYLMGTLSFLLMTKPLPAFTAE